jgi:hypothetical protein
MRIVAITAKGGARRLPAFLRSLERKGLDLKGLSARAEVPIVFLPPHGGQPALGFDATILPELCEAILAARREGFLLKQQAHVGRQCEILLGAFAKVGIVALVDEATGYQDARSRDALAIILEAFIAKELRPWVKMFQPDFYKEMFRLRGWQWKGMAVNRPQVVAHYTNDLVYSRLAPGVLHELEARNPRNEKGQRRAKHHQWLTPDIGHPKLREHLVVVTALMKAEDEWNTFKRKLDRVCPPYGKTIPLALPEPDA